MKFTQFIKEIGRVFFPIIVIDGEDAYLRESALTKIRESLDLSMPELNLSLLNGEETSIKELLSLANSFPAFSSKRMIVVKDYPFGKKSAEKNLQELFDYCQNPNDTTCLVFVFNNAVGQFSLNNSSVVDCNRLDSGTIVAWIISTLKARNIKIERGIAQKISDYCDKDMYKVSQSVNKLAVYCGAVVDDDAVELLVPKDVEYVVYDLSNAIVSKNGARAIEICTKLLSEEESSKIFASVYSSVRRMFYAIVSDMSDAELAQKLSVNPFAITKAREQGERFGAVKLKRGMELCAKTEINLKNFDGNDKTLIYDLVLALCNL